MTSIIKKFVQDGRFWLLALMTILLVFFPYPSSIHNALTHAPAGGYSVAISIWRISFEPLFGPIIFMMRSPKPLQLYSSIFIVTLLLLLWPAWRRSGSYKKRFFYWLQLATVCLILFISLLLAIIVAPIPSDVIRNQSQDVILVNPHSHSHFSHDGLVSHRRLMAWHRYQGFAAFFLTDHNRNEQTLNAVAAQRAGDMAAEPLLLAGMEYSGSNHILVLGLKRPFNSKDYGDTRIIDTCHAQQGTAIVAHWFTPAKRTRPLADYVAAGCDGFEIVNQAEGAFYAGSKAEPVITTCIENNLTMVAGCDYHGYGYVCQSWTGLTIPGWHNLNQNEQQENILDIFRRRQQDKITVLVIHDRPQGSLPALLRPVTFFINYSRSLNFWQLFSWFTWVLLLSRFKIRKQLVFKSLAIIGVVFLLMLGCYWLITGYQLAGYNEILVEYGRYLVLLGLLFTFLLWKFFKNF